MAPHAHTAETATMKRAARADRLAPVLFPVFWSSGSVAAKIGLTERRRSPSSSPCASPFVAAILIPASLLLRSQYPRDPQHFMHIAVTGLIMV
ncbi:MAG: hypothetical protein R3D03_07570 [Geminicoccaceae bacterium]